MFKKRSCLTIAIVIVAGCQSNDLNIIKSMENESVDDSLHYAQIERKKDYGCFTFVIREVDGVAVSTEDLEILVLGGMREFEFRRYPNTNSEGKEASLVHGENMFFYMGTFGLGAIFDAARNIYRNERSRTSPCAYARTGELSYFIAKKKKYVKKGFRYEVDVANQDTFDLHEIGRF